jgi:hypothetical protein
MSKYSSFFGNPTNKTGAAYTWELLIANHFDQSLWSTNQKYWTALRNNLLHSTLEVHNCVATFTSHGKLHEFGAEKPTSWAKPAHFDFFHNKFYSQQSHSEHGWRCSNKFLALLSCTHHLLTSFGGVAWAFASYEFWACVLYIYLFIFMALSLCPSSMQDIPSPHCFGLTFKVASWGMLGVPILLLALFPKLAKLFFFFVSGVFPSYDFTWFYFSCFLGLVSSLI